jgi:hypothetical protein
MLLQSQVLQELQELLVMLLQSQVLQELQELLAMLPL